MMAALFVEELGERAAKCTEAEERQRELKASANAKV